MNIDTIFGYMAGLLTALIILLVKHFLGKSQTLEIQKKNRRQIACDKFRAAIAQEISLWYSCMNPPISSWVMNETGTPLDMLKKNSITTAFFEFRPFVANYIKDYDKTYNSYENHKNNCVTEIWRNIQCSKHSIDLLQDLLRFAEK